MSVEGKLDQVSSQAEGAKSGRQGCEHPPTDGTVDDSQRNACQHGSRGHVILRLGHSQVGLCGNRYVAKTCCDMLIRRGFTSVMERTK